MEKLTCVGWSAVVALLLSFCGKLEANGSTNVLSVCDEPSLRAAIAGGGWVSVTCNGTVTLANTIYITNNVILDASGVSFGISGGNAVQIFNVTNGASLGGTNLMLANGSYSLTSNILTTNAEGGAIYNYGTVSLMCCTLTNNSARAMIVGGTGRGGAIFNDGGTVTLSQSRIVNNLTVGGGPYSPLDLTNPDTTILNTALGGAIYNAGGALTIAGCTFSSNLCESVVEDLFYGSGGNNHGLGLAMGGAVFQAAGSMGITNSSFAMNQAIGGDAEDFESTLPGPAYGGALAVAGGSLSIDHSQFGTNGAIGGAAIDGEIGYQSPGGTAFGGAIYCAAEANISDSSFFGNQAPAGFGNGKAASGCGGGIYNAGDLELIRCVVYANSALGGAGAAYDDGIPSAGGDALGGGIFNNGPQLAITNCTIALNSTLAGYSFGGDPGWPLQDYASGNAQGGGAFNYGTMLVMNVTVASNNCASPGANLTNGWVSGIQVANGGTLSLRNSILAYGGTNSNVGGAITDDGYNICSDASADLAGPGSLNNTDPLLETLSNYGGPTFCMALSSNSPAIGAGGSAGAPATDQRGAARTGAIDIGAYQSGVYTNLSNQLNVADEGHLRAAIADGGWVRILCDGTVTLSNTICVYNNLVLDASGVSFGISGGNAVRLFTVACGGSLTLTNMTLANGSCILITNDVTTNADGGAIYSSGTVMLTGCTLTNNSAQALIIGGTARGGAIFNNGGAVTLYQSYIVNSLAFGGGPNSQIPPTNDPTIIDTALGGAIYNAGGSVAISGCTVYSNSCQNVVENNYYNNGTGLAMGGAVYQVAGSIEITNSSFTMNQTVGGNGVYFDITIPSPAYGGALAVTGGSLSIEDSLFGMNQARGGVPEDSSIAFSGTGGVAYGGAIYCTSDGTFADSSFFENQTVAGSGDGKAASGCGGGIYNGGNLELDRCSIYSNIAQGGDGIPFNGGEPSAGGDALGGGIYNDNGARLAATNCTIALNSSMAGTGSVVIEDPFSLQYSYGANGNAQGGGVCNTNGIILMMNDTVASNNCVAQGFNPTNGLVTGVQVSNGGTLSMHNSIIAYSGTNGNAYGPITDIGHDISSDGSADLTGPGSLNNTDPLLGPLANYGGPTWCMALEYDSPAIDTGDSAGAPATDQRGDARPHGAGVDIGAYEFYSNQIDIPRLNLVSEVTDSGTNSTLSFATYPSGHYYLQTSKDMVNWVTLMPAYSPSVGETNMTAAVPNVYAQYGFFRLMMP